MRDKLRRYFSPQSRGEPSTVAPPTVLPADAGDALVAESTPSELLWYLAYGSNLNASVFKRRRGISPRAQRNVLVTGLELTFDLAGLPYLEPRFANCRFATVRDPSIVSSKNGAEDEKVQLQNGTEAEPEFDLDAPWTGAGALIGVAYLVTPEDFARIIATEGGGSSYKMVAVEGRVLAPDQRAQGQAVPGTDACPGTGVTLTGEVIRAFTLLAPAAKTRQKYGEPSPRYLSLIRQGAEECALPLAYRTYLAGLKAYTLTTWRQKFGRALMVTACLPVLLPVMLLGSVLAGADGKYPDWFGDMQRRIFTAMWGAYDRVWAGRFGDGERTICVEDAS
ncbi:hypothetical protein M0805_004580 [Coniferiporia weirii]|nr:hypothetical protein M0805_004580 [Coniferiporia weirii]